MVDRKLELVEPTFVLRASDPAAPSLLRQWARRHEIRMKKGIVDHGVRPDDVVRARQLATDMEVWAQQDAVRRYHEVIHDIRTRVDKRVSAEVIKLRRPE